MTAAKPQTPPSRLTNFPGLAEYEAPDKMHEGRVGIADFDGVQVRWMWRAGERWFSIVDVIGALVESTNPKDYWAQTKRRMKNKEGAEQSLTDCQRLKLPSLGDGKNYATDCASTQILLRIIQSVPSPKIEPLKLWLAKLGQERLEEIAQPSKAIDRTIDAYRKLGRDDPWIDSRLQAVAARNQLTNEWKERGVAKMGVLTARMGKEMLGVTPGEHRDLKGLPEKAEVRDHMDRLELAVVTFGEQAAATLIVEGETKDAKEATAASMAGAKIAGDARRVLESQLGRPVANGNNFLAAPAVAPELPAPAPATKASKSR